MFSDSMYRSSQLALLRDADNLPSFWRLLGNGSDEIATAHDALMEQRCVLNQLLSLGLHIGTNDMSSALDLAYQLNWATQQLCIAFRDAVVAPALWEAKRRCEMVGEDADGPALRDAFRDVCREMFGHAFSGSGHEDLMFLAVHRRFRRVELAGEHIGQQVIRPFSSQKVESRPSHRRRHNR
jgi:hypothetical protein